MRQVIQSAVNFSEGKNQSVVDAIVSAARIRSPAVVADYSSDADHHRSVVTFLGEPQDIRSAVFASAKVAVESIDLRRHKGAHPRIGAVDVVPLVPIRGVTMDECVLLSREIAGDFADKLHVPVYLYERSALALHRLKLPDIRRGGFEALSAGSLDGDRLPDMGPTTCHPMAGAVVVGARGPLVAYNIDLDSQDMKVPQAIVRKIRSGESGLTGVKAMSVHLNSRSRVQVSMNLTQPDETPVEPVFEFVEAEAKALGVSVAESEFIGLVSMRYLPAEPRETIKALRLRDTQILEYWL